MSSNALLKRQPLAPLSKLTLGALLIEILAFALLLIQIGEIVTPIAIIMICLLLISISVLTGWRWTPLLGTAMGVGTFKGQKLQLIDDGAFPHVIKNGTWDASGNPITRQEPGAPTVDLTINTGTAQVGPFNTAGTYHFYCTIHQNMNLTIVVQ